MKIKILYFLLSLPLAAGAQIELIYEAPSNSSPVLVADNSVKNAVVDLQPGTTQFELYNLDNSLFRVCQLPPGISPGTLWWISYPTLAMFDCDSTNVEYILVQPAGSIMNPSPPHTWVVREDGTVLLDLPGYTFYGSAHSHNAINQGGIWNDGESAVMNVIEGNFTTEPRRYYRLCGSAPAMYGAALMGGLTGLAPYTGGTQGSMQLYPNPALDVIRLDYTLPA